jgi:hypothetical protein
MEIVDALVANKFALVLNKALCRSAEHTAVLKFAENDMIVFNENFHFIVFGDIQSSSELNGKYDPAQFIHFANDAGRFHNTFALSVV